ncbi:MAG TPA: family 1 glycosylhydrolase [Dissulfurispiraceae bacterium]|nr:family 1 glycosylhydrolase [Dissulfurispiraceae bacterium]
MNSPFLWGVATSAFQLEGSPYADWTSWDLSVGDNPDITHHYDLYRQDLRLLKALGVNAYRFSLEWSRIQPGEDIWDRKAVDHYQEMIDILNDHGIEPMVTIHHFTHPLWFIRRYPWHDDRSIDRFLRYVDRLLASVRDVRYWITFNEPYVLLLGGYLEGCMPPGLRDADLALAALKNILVCHGRAYEIIHNRRPDALVSVAHNMAALAPWHRWNPLDRALATIATSFYNHSLLDVFKSGSVRVKFPFRKATDLEAPIQGKLDFFGINYYTRVHLRFNPLKKMGVELRHRDIDGYGLTDLGWEIHPHGLDHVIRKASALGVPLMITENGIATHDSQKKIRFMKRHVDVIEKCIKKGFDIRGYFYWSLIDNYEWLQGLDARFGLYTVDYSTFRRRPTTAATYYSYLIRSRSFT